MILLNFGSNITSDGGQVLVNVGELTLKADRGLVACSKDLHNL